MQMQSIHWSSFGLHVASSLQVLSRTAHAPFCGVLKQASQAVLLHMPAGTPPVPDETPPVFDEAPPVFDEAPPVPDEAPPVFDEAPPVFDEAPPVLDLELSESVPSWEVLLQLGITLAVRVKIKNAIQCSVCFISSPDVTSNQRRSTPIVTIVRQDIQHFRTRYFRSLDSPCLSVSSSAAVYAVSLRAA
jgi:hypothetical protein